MQDGYRYNIPVRATRAYVAGFGTSGSLLAGAAVLFLLGSAIVAFNGWPQIGGGPATSNVSAAPLASTSHASTRLIHALAATAPRAHGAGVLARSGAALGAAHQGVAGRSVTRGTPAPTRTDAGTGAPSGAGALPIATPASACGSCSHPVASPSPVTTATNRLAPVTDRVAQTVSTVGNDVGNQITSLGSSTSSNISKVSPPVGSVVGAAGSAVGNTVTGTATTAANTLTSVGNALGGH